MKQDIRKGRNLKVLIVLGSIGLSISLLIYLEQIALIYVLSTVALIVLLLIVAFADLEKVGEEARHEAYDTEPIVEESAILKTNKLDNIERRKRYKQKGSHELLS